MTKRTHPLPFLLIFILSLLFLLALFAAAVTFGAADTSLQDVWRALTGAGTNETVTMLQEIRFPREAGAAAVGAALAVSGAVMQGLTRNPLADPGLLGLTAGANAALAVTLAFLPGTGYFGIMIACFIGAAAGTLLVFGISAAKRGGFSPFRMVLAGAAVSAFLYAISEGIGLAFELSKDVSMWTAGGLIGTTWQQLAVIVPFIGGGIVLALFLSRQLTILSMSEEVAVGLGQKTALVKSLLLAVVILLAGASVALVGNLVFLGLMIPHIVRFLAGQDYRYVIPLSAVIGAAFMLFADTLGRTINAPYETPVAAIVSLLGLPFFLFIVRKGGVRFP